MIAPQAAIRHFFQDIHSLATAELSEKQAVKLGASLLLRIAGVVAVALASLAAFKALVALTLASTTLASIGFVVVLLADAVGVAIGSDLCIIGSNLATQTRPLGRVQAAGRIIMTPVRALRQSHSPLPSYFEGSFTLGAYRFFQAL